MTRIIDMTRFVWTSDFGCYVKVYASNAEERTVFIRTEPNDEVRRIAMRCVWRRLPGLYVSEGVDYDPDVLYQEDYEED